MSKRFSFIPLLFLFLTFVYGQGHLKYYGFAIVDCGWDDPLDNEVKTNYLSEVDSFTNVNQLCVFDPGDDITQRVTDMNVSGVRPILHVQEIFYEDIDGTLYLRSDYQSRWNTFTSTNNSVLFPDSLAAFYLVDEPVHNGLSFEDLQTVSDLVKSDYPAIPTLIIEAWPDVDSLQIPLSIDWCGFDKYGVYDPNTDSEYQQLLAALKSKRSDPDQRIVIIMDAQFLPDYYGLGWTPDTMKTVAANYYNLAVSDSDVIALVCYLWPGGLDNPAQMGARELPQTVQDEYVRIGQLIINDVVSIAEPREDFAFLPPEDFKLLQNYPNPFGKGHPFLGNSQTTIAYQIPFPGYVRLRIFNSLGQEVRTLLDRHQSVGSYSVVWDGRENSWHKVAAGIYLLQMKTKNFVQTKKILYLK